MGKIKLSVRSKLALIYLAESTSWNLFAWAKLFSLHYRLLSIIWKDRLEVSILDSPNANFVEVQQEVTHHLSAQNRIVSVFRVLVDVLPHPLCKRQPVSSRSVKEELLYSSNNFAYGFAGQRTRLNSALNLGENSCE